jgi:hypothetical protein
MTTLTERRAHFRAYQTKWRTENVKTQIFDKISGAVERSGTFHAGSTRREGKIPDGIGSFLQQHGLNADAMYRAGQKFTVAQIDGHFATRDASPSDRMSVKSCLRQLNLLAE